MKKLLFALIATIVAVSVSGCAGMGKGKAPPVVTSGRDQGLIRDHAQGAGLRRPFFRLK